MSYFNLILSNNVTKLTETELFSPSIKKLSMSEGNITPGRQFIEIGDAHLLVEPASDFEDNLQSKLLERKFSSSQVDKNINAIVAQLATQHETLMQSLRKLNEIRPTD